MNAISIKHVHQGGNSHCNSAGGCKAARPRALPSPPHWGEGAMGGARVNRRMAAEGQGFTTYEANELNQYSSINETEAGEQYSFTPTFDDAGNQCTVKTGTGIWAVVYNAENRPTSFTRANTDDTWYCYVFVAIRHMRGDMVRCVGLARSRIRIGLVNLAYNMLRFCQLSSRTSGVLCPQH